MNAAHQPTTQKNKKNLLTFFSKEEDKIEKKTFNNNKQRIDFSGLLT